ncbi:Ig-like domain-containing protein [Mycolicibacterium sphagni]|uniref:Cadherin domain-containing protein n=1 Tax=Mycolicibacterium sphagni TaxID=1786 RepID=A0ABX2K0L4_9MYCO|nr:Ig-like domain-containing protein [Mycolicibacterium sphagni]NTY63190.1 hypothetical protein [Mycolicibacterium sphagni]
MYTIWVPRLAAAAFTLGVGAAVLSGASEAAAAPDSGGNSATSSTAHASPAKRPGKAAGTKTSAGQGSSRDKPNSSPVSAAAAASVPKSAVSARQDTGFAAQKQRNPSLASQQLAMLFKYPADTILAGVAVALGYAPDDLYGSDGVTPLRTLVEQALAGARHQMNGAAPNQAPTARPVQLREFGTSEIIGDLLPSDANGDKLTYTVVSAPTEGTFVVNKNGTYYYTPNATLAQTGGVDVVRVAISDGTTSTTVDVPVKVSPRTITLYKGFDINNVTSGHVQLTGYTDGATDDMFEPPATPTTYGSIDSVHLSVAQYMFKSVVVGVGFKGDQGELWTVYLRTPPAAILDDKASTWCASSGGSCSAPAKNQWIDLLDSAGTVITVGSDDPIRQAELLYRLCPDGGRFSCNFVTGLKDEETVFLNRHLIGVMNNAGSGTLSWESSKTETLSETTSVTAGFELSGVLAKLINLKISGSYRHDWTSTIAITTKWSYAVQPYTRLKVYVSDPYYRVWGNFTIRAGNTTYQIEDVSFDTPISGLAAELDAVTEPIAH